MIIPIRGYPQDFNTSRGYFSSKIHFVLSGQIFRQANNVSKYPRFLDTRESTGENLILKPFQLQCNEK